jgi:hypothetical protein
MDHRGYEPALREALRLLPQAQVIWLSDGLDDPTFVTFLKSLNLDSMIIHRPEDPSVALLEVSQESQHVAVRLHRSFGGFAQQLVLRAKDQKGLDIISQEVSFAADELSKTALLTLPLELRNDIYKLDLVGHASAGATYLLGANLQRKRVALVTSSNADRAQPLLSSDHYLTKALSPFADLVTVPQNTVPHMIAEGLEAQPHIMVLGDMSLPQDTLSALTRYVEGGGLVLRFAGEKLAAQSDGFLPVALRQTERNFTGALSWTQAQKIGSFSNTSPLADLIVPEDVHIYAQVLANPNPDLNNQIWSSLKDGTPFITAKAMGKGTLILCHVSADTSWSDFVLSGTFLEMMQRVLRHARFSSALNNTSPTSKSVLPALFSLDGFGVLKPASLDIKPLDHQAAQKATLETPAGFYGTQEAQFAINMFDQDSVLKPLDVKGLNAQVLPLKMAQHISLTGLFLSFALGLFLLDWLIMLLLNRRTVLFHALGGLFLCFFIMPVVFCVPAQAQAQPNLLQHKASLQPILAYIITGDQEVDQISHAGLDGLSLYMSQRTSYDYSAPIGVDLTHDDLSFYPLLYWPVLGASPMPNAQSLAKLTLYMKHGGTILFDTKDAHLTLSNATALTENRQALRALLAKLDVPPLQPVPQNHVMTKTFYLLTEFYGRYSSGQTWVALTSSKASKTSPVIGDQVSPLIVTSNDLAGAWAIDKQGMSLLPLVPNLPQQRDYSYRAGVNIMMYVLTGTYKTDQVHVPALLERLGSERLGQ